VLPQEIPGVVEATRPVPNRCTARVSRISVKVAVAERAWLMVTVHVLVPVHAPVQPAKREPVPGVAVRVTFVPYAKLLEQALPHEIASGLEVTLPDPFPPARTVSNSGMRLRVALTDCAWFMVTAQVPVPVHAPVQPTKTEPVAGLAVRMTVAP
jgi:hypothetical protein